MDTLNDYCLLHIFQYFSPKDRLNISKVCERWNNLTKSNWKESKFTVLEHSFVTKNETLSLKELQAILKHCGPSLRDVSLIPINKSNKTASYVRFDSYTYSTNNFTTTDALQVLSKVAFNITSLYIRCCNLPLDSMEESFDFNNIVQRQCQLTKLEMEGDYNYFDNLIDLDLLPETLQQISFSFIYFETNVLCPFLRRMSQMRKLKLIEGNLITERSLVNLSTYLVRLQALHLEEDVEEGSDISITAMENISKLVNLEELSIKGFINTMVDRVLILIANRCTKIKELGLSGCKNISNNGMKQALMDMQKLQTLEIKSLSISGLSTQRSSLVLNKLKIYRCENLSSEALCNAIQTMRFLSHLEIHSSEAVSETVLYAALTAAIPRNQNLVLTEDINSIETLRVTISKKINSNELAEENPSTRTFYFQCQPIIPHWLTKVRNHVSTMSPKCQISEEIIKHEESS